MERLSPEVLAVVQMQFSPAEQPVALELLQRYGSAPHEREHDRVYLALLELSQGDVGYICITTPEASPSEVPRTHFQCGRRTRSSC